jgi:uncharacterized protein
MIQPVEMQQTLPMTLHGGAMSTTTEVWEMLCACRDGDLDKVMQLVSRRPELATCQYNYTPPLHLAVREGHLPLVQTLVKLGAFDPRYKTYPFGDTFLSMAQDRAHDEIAALLQDALSRPEFTRTWRETGDIDYRQDEEQRNFDKAVHEDSLQEVERLLKHRPQLALNEMSSWAEGVLMMPSRGANRAMLELLMKYGAKVPAISKWGRFYYFANTEIAAFHLQGGMDPNHMNWHHVTLLHDMSQSGDIPKATLLLDSGADINAIDEEYRSSPLGLAARWGKRDMVAFLLERGADPNRAGAQWSTPLAWAQKKGHLEIVRDLAAAGASET